MGLFSSAVLMCRQNLYKSYLHCDETKLKFTDLVVDQIADILIERKGISGSEIRKELTLKGIRIGKDKFYNIIKRYHLTLNSRRKAWKRSHVRLPASPNLIMNRTFHRVFEVLFSDYTEIETAEGKLQLVLVEDLISRYITSWRISNTCTSEPVLAALQESMELKHSLKLSYSTIFHTDKGSEYVNHAIRNYAHEVGILLSNTGKNNCHENPYMESLNKTLKYCLGLRTKYTTRQEAVDQIKDAIERYNKAHKHGKLGKRVPYSVLIGYTAQKSKKPEEKTGSCPPPGRGARTYTKSLTVKVKTIKLDNRKKHTK